MAAVLTTTIASNPPAPGSVDAGQWEELLQRSSTRTVFQTVQWQDAWWQAYGRGQRLYVSVEQGSRLLALAPLFAADRMAFFVGSGGSDYLNFLGDVGDPEVLTAILETVRLAIPDFIGCHFYHVPDDSGTSLSLRRAASQLGWDCYEEAVQVAPALQIADAPEAAAAASRKKSLLRKERYFDRAGTLEVIHLNRGDAIRPHLEEFFEQHRRRWAETKWPSLFCDPAHCDFYRRLTEQRGVDWLRFTRIESNCRPVAFHFGFCYSGTFLWYKPSFAIDLARHSPGEVLLRQLLLRAIAERVELFDFGLGDEAFKDRFATVTRTVRNWGVYPR